MCNESVLIIIGNIYKKAILNLGYGAATFGIFLQNELVM
jgi:hypothetical protein